MTQIDYRLRVDAGDSRAVGDGGRPIGSDAEGPGEWVGEGLREVGIEPRTPLDAHGVAVARMLAKGCDPRTGEVLVVPKKAIHPEAKLDAGPLVAALGKAVENSGVTPAELLGDRRLVTRLERLQRGVSRAERRATGLGPGRETVVHRARVSDLEALGAAVGIDVGSVYGVEKLSHAREFAKLRVVVGNCGYVLRFTVPKSYSVLMAMASTEVADELENAYLDAVRETVNAMHGWAGYGMRGEHGHGHTAQRMDSTGLLGWLRVRRTASPTAGFAPDPHLHAHVTLLNLVRGIDGRWSTVGSGGRAIYRHAVAAHAYLSARLRAVSQQRWGIEWARNPHTSAWEVAAVPPGLRTAFSKRSQRVKAQLLADGIDPEQASTGQAQRAATKSLEAKVVPFASGDLRDAWHHQAREEGFDPAEVVAAAMPGSGHQAPTSTVATLGLPVGRSLTARRKVITRADVLTSVMDAQPAGIQSVAEAELLADQVQAELVSMPATQASTGAHTASSQLNAVPGASAVSQHVEAGADGSQTA